MFNFDQRLVDAFKKFSNRLAIRQVNGSNKSRDCNFSELAEISSQVKNFLDLQVPENRPVGIMMSRSIEHVSCIVGALFSNKPFFCINPLVTVTQIIQMCNSSECNTLICDPSTILRLGPLATEKVDGLRIFFLSNAPPGMVQQQVFDKIAATNNIKQLNLDDLPKSNLSNKKINGPDSPRFYLYTSGSTGTPKGVVIQNENLNSRVINEINAYQITPEDRLLNVLPFSFDVGLNQVLTSLISGSSITLLNSWLARDIVTTIANLKISGFSGVPTIWQSIIESGIPDIEKELESLRYLTISAGDLPEKLRMELRELAKLANIYKTYGQTETFRSGMLFPDEFNAKQGSVGRPPDGVSVEIVLESGSLGCPDEIGEIVHAGAGSMLGYVGDQTATAEKIRPAPIGFNEKHSLVVYTGDRGRIDSDGYLYVLGRMDRMIKIRGNRVYPEEVESQLLSNTVIDEAVVLRNSETDSLIAVIVYQQLKSMTAEELNRYLSTRLPAYMIPAQYIETAQLPRTASAKIDIAQITILINKKVN